jgi:hypothetical protein
VLVKLLVALPPETTGMIALNVGQTAHGAVSAPSERREKSTALVVTYQPSSG